MAISVGKAENEPMVEPNVIPLVDVMLVSFFMFLSMSSYTQIKCCLVGINHHEFI